MLLYGSVNDAVSLVLQPLLNQNDIFVQSASPLGTSRLRGGVMKANVNYNLKGDEEPGV